MQTGRRKIDIAKARLEISRKNAIFASASEDAPGGLSERFMVLVPKTSWLERASQVRILYPPLSIS